MRMIATAALAAALIATPGNAQTAAKPAAGKADPARMSETAKTLGSDAFEGRGPGTPGGKKTISYLIGRFKAMGLQPGGPKGSWTQPVPLIHTQIGEGTIALTSADGKRTPIKQGPDINLTTVRADTTIAISNAPMVFVGYGVNAPEIGWDDFKGVDLHGKVAIFLVNDPDFDAVAGEDVNGKFGGKRMTYYGRWTYKFEEAARRGAVAALVIHDTDAAGYGWETVSASNGENYDIVRGPDEQTVPLQGWLQHEEANRLFTDAGLDLDTLRKKARSAAFKPVTLANLRLTATLPVKTERVESANVIAKIPGKTHPNETILFGAHWDAYGQGKPDKDGKTIRPGANDDGLGVAGVLELARLFKAAPAPQRTLVFGVWTAEERGLLGSEYYAKHPVYPIATTVADLTMDILQTAGPAHNVIEVGKGNSSLDADLAKAATAQGRTVDQETFVERGLFYRADHFSLAKRGVPSLLLMALGGAPDLKTGGEVAGQAWLDGYMKCYHQTCDQWNSDWDLRGAAKDVDLYYRIGAALANDRLWPSWAAGSQFGRLRTESAAARK